jgi:hypothetical protein
MMEQVARKVEPPTGSASNSADQSSAATSAPTIATRQADNQRTAVAKQETDKEAENKQARVGEEQAAAPPPVATPVEVEKSVDDLAKRPRPSEPAAAPAVGGATAVKTGTEADKNEGARQKKDESAVARDAKAKEEDRAYQAAPQTAASGAAKTQVDSQSERAAKLHAARREAPPKEVERAQDTEVRSVGGHRFERRGDVWVDVLYESQPTIHVSRGSEQYRALIGDEPGIRTIAEQLSGDLIVVWKSRAYRIR